MKENSSPAYYLLIIVVSFCAFFVNNHIVPADLMESRNLATAQEMARTGNYLIPTMNGELRLEKPPLPTWIAAGVETILPGNLNAQRCASGIAATFMVIFLYLLAVRLSGSRNIAIAAAVIFATCYNPVMMGRTASWDIYCHSFMLGAIYFLVCSISARCRGFGWMFLSGLFMGLSFLSKGPVAFYALLLPFIIAYALVVRPKMSGKGLPLVVLLATALATSLWWYGWLYFTQSETIAAAARKETTAWMSRNVKPFWYYWQFPAEAGIWALFWVTSIIYFFAKRRPGRHRRLFAFSIVWTVTSLLLLSLIPEKKTRYLLPLLVPGAVNIAMYLWNIARNPTSRADRIVFRLNGLVVSLVLLAIPVFIYVMFLGKGLMPVPLFVVIAVIFLVVTAVIVRSLVRKGSRMDIKSVFASMVVAMMALEAFCLPAVGSMFINDERHSIRNLRDDPRTEGLAFYYEADKPLRMELVYEADAFILPLDLSDSALMRKVPLVLVSQEPAELLLEGSGLTVEHLDTYDNNWRKRGHKRYNPDLVRHAAVVSLPPAEDEGGDREEDN
ncbi:MAG: glycosyltransferase family 39 protein [Rikenellaceae bacterium]|nr:glycosyltransferase family 39 protein [Rikenellaceae bacterium]